MTAKPFSQSEAQKIWEKAISLLEEGRDDDAMPYLHKLWMENYTGAAFEIACIIEKMARRGEVIFDEMEIWYRRAVDEDECITHRYNLARALLIVADSKSKEIAKYKIDESIEIMMQLSREGFSYASLHLGILYSTGYSVECDLVKAEALLQDAIDKGGYILAYLLMRKISWQKREYIKCIKLTIVAVSKFINVYMKDKNDERLSIMNKICGM